MSVIAFDLADRAGAGRQRRDRRCTRERSARKPQRKDAAEAKAAAKRDLRNEIPAVLALFRREVGPARLMAVWIAKDRITFIQADRAIFDYDRRGTFATPQASPTTSLAVHRGLRRPRDRLVRLHPARREGDARGQPRRGGPRPRRYQRRAPARMRADEDRDQVHELQGAASRCGRSTPGGGS